MRSFASLSVFFSCSALRLMSNSCTPTSSSSSSGICCEAWTGLIFGSGFGLFPLLQHESRQRHTPRRPFQPSQHVHHLVSSCRVLFSRVRYFAFFLYSTYSFQSFSFNSGSVSA